MVKGRSILRATNTYIVSERNKTSELKIKKMVLLDKHVSYVNYKSTPLILIYLISYVQYYTAIQVQRK